MPRLLIVDDLEQNRYLLQALLTGHGYEVVLASDGIEALEAARSAPPDLIITDILMPRMDGFSLCRNWKNDENLRNIPLIFYTATYTDPKDEKFALSLGASRYIIKPQEPDVFVTIINEVLNEYQSGKPLISQEPFIEETVYFKDYSDALIRKLEDKLTELESAKETLEHEITERIRVEDALRRSEKELRIRNRIADVFLTISDDEMYAETLKIILDALNSDVGAFGYIDMTGALIVPSLTRNVWDKCQVADKDIVFPQETWGNSIWGRSIREKKVLFSNQPCCNIPQGHIPIQKVIAAPVINQDTVVGLILAANKESDYDEYDIQLLDSLCSAIAPILNARLQRIQYEKERALLERQLRQAQKMEAIGQLAGGVAHDFNNIIQAIMGYTAFALEETSPESELYANLQQVIKGAEHAASLTRQLLAFSRQQVFVRKDIDLNELVMGLMKMIHRVISENIELNFVPGPNLGAVNADPGQLEQVILNICINARDAMPDGGQLTVETKAITIDDSYCQAHPWAKPGFYVVLKISDTGIGMDEETQRQVFEPFFTTKGIGKGTGLGLATVYGIVKQHEGFIHVYSEVGKGTIFRIYLPSAARPAVKVEKPVQAPIKGGFETILFAEDNAALRALGIRVLEKVGYKVLAAVDGEEAVEIFKAHADEIALALLDVVMPKMGGRAAYEEIKTIRPGIRVLFTSGYTAGDVGMRAIIRDHVQLIEKPYEPHALQRKVRDVLDLPVS